MRLRNIPRAESVLEACKEVVKNPESLCGHWNQEFQNERPLHIEIGIGKAHGLDIGAAVQLGAGAVGPGDVDGADLAQGHAVGLVRLGAQLLIGRAQQRVLRVDPLDQIVVPGLPDGVRGHMVILAQVGAAALLHVQQHRLIRSQPLAAEQGCRLLAKR